MSCPCTNSWDAFRRLSRFALELSMSGFAPECSILMYGCRCLSHLFLLQQQEVIPVGTRERIQLSRYIVTDSVMCYRDRTI